MRKAVRFAEAVPTAQRRWAGEALGNTTLAEAAQQVDLYRRERRITLSAGQGDR
jgi:hypothetical protein